MAGENSTYAHKFIDKHFEDHWQMPDFTFVGKGSLSKDGKTLTYTMTGTNAGKALRDFEVYEKQ